MLLRDGFHSKTLSFSQRSEFEQFWTSHVTTPLEGRNSIVASFCPQVFGLYVVKLSVCLALIGGVEVGGATKSCDWRHDRYLQGDPIG